MRDGSHFKLILVRHGVSCANLKKARGDSFSSSYMDPELTRLGQIKAENRGVAFREELSARGMAYPIVMASMLMRAQQTAFLMMDTSQIYIAPYISEIGSKFWFKSTENIPYKPSEQVRIMDLEGKTPFLTANGRDERRIYLPSQDRFPEDATEPSPARFISWLGVCIQRMNEQYPMYESLSANMSPMSANQQRNLNRIANIDRTLAAMGGPLPREAGLVLDEKIMLQMKWEDIRASKARPVVVFTHGNYIQAFIKSVAGGRRGPTREERPNYSAFEFNVTMRDGKLQFEYIGPFEYAPFDTDDYATSARLDKDKECAADRDGNKDMCIKAVCPGTRRKPLQLRKAKSEQIRRQEERKEAERQGIAALENAIRAQEEKEKRERVFAEIYPHRSAAIIQFGERDRSQPPVAPPSMMDGPVEIVPAPPVAATRRRSNSNTTYLVEVNPNGSNGSNGRSQYGGRRHTRRHKRRR